LKDDSLYLRHILEAIDRIRSYTSQGRDAFRRDLKTRDRIVHDYFGVSLEIVWDVVENHLPPLRDKVRRLLPED
jgi:uncharacterized protein with HEPN domain